MVDRSVGHAMPVHARAIFSDADEIPGAQFHRLRAVDFEPGGIRYRQGCVALALQH